MSIKTLIAAAAASVAVAGAAVAEPVETNEVIDEFRIGILGGENASDRLRSNECLRARMEEQLGVETKLFAPADYNGVIEGLLGGSIDLAWLGASGYAKVFLTDPEAVQPVLVKINTDGSYGYYSVGFTRTDSGIESLADMEGKTFAFGDPNSTSGYLIPSIEIPQEAEEITMEPGDYFGDVVFAGGHEQTIVGVYNGDYDAGVTWADGLGAWEDGYNSGALRKAVDAGLVDMTELRQIWQSNVIPEGPIVVRKDLPERVKLEVVGAFASLESMDAECAYGVMAGEVKGVAPISHDVYTSVIEARRTVMEDN